MRGEVWWADLPEPVRSAPGYRRPVVIIQADVFSGSRIATVVVVGISASPWVRSAPGNVALPRGTAGLPRDSTINVSQILTIDKAMLIARMGTLSRARMRELEDGLRLVLGL